MAMAALIAIFAIVGLSAGIAYAFPAPGQSTLATTQVEASKLTDCGYATACSARNPSGLQLSLSVNSTSVNANGSFSFIVSLSNPSAQEINEPDTGSWYLPNLPLWMPCYDGFAAYAYGVFRGYYTLLNVSTAENVLHPITYPTCISPSIYNETVGPVTIPAMSTYTPSTSFQIYAVSGGTVRSGNISLGVLSLWSDKPAEYTMVAEDPWGDFVLLNFSVVPASP